GSVADTIGGRKIDRRKSGSDAGEAGIQLGIGFVGKENRPGLSIESFDMANSIVFFIGAREFVLFNDAIDVLLATGGGHESQLRMGPHNLAVQIKGWLLILDEQVLGDQPFEVLFSL